ncbi:MAG: helix-turn-helix transcriptional regulator [Clostridia bacterium]|nr:helix-turn-helix transcriptional regulator [Clostridia bacterium]
MMNTAHFGRIMRERRENSYISLRALSDVVDMSEHALRNIELGDSDPKHLLSQTQNFNNIFL